MSWNHWIRRSHRWVSIAFTAGVVFNGLAVGLGKYTAWMGLLAGVPLLLLLLSGLYLFVLPYTAKWRGGRSAA